jgi:hypothetical protein
VNITYIWRDLAQRWETTEWRGMSFIKAINRTKRHKAIYLPDLEFISNTVHSKKICDQSDIIIIHQDLWGKRLSLIQYWKARGKTVIADFDISLQSIKNVHPEFKFWTEGVSGIENECVIDPSPIAQFKWGLQLVDGATTPSQKLADEWNSFTPVFCVPSYINLEKYIHLLPQPHDHITLGWKGDQILTFKQSGAFDAIEEVLRVNPETRFLVFSDTIGLNQFERLPKNQVQVIPFAYGRNWPEPLSQLDIGIVPQEDKDYYAAFGNDILEYMALKIPWIGNTNQYLSSVGQYGWLVENNPLAWKTRLQDMIENIEEYRKMAGLASYLHAIGQSIDENVQNLIHTYAKISHQSKMFPYLLETQLHFSK